MPSLIIGDWAKEVKVSQAGNYPDCEICHYKAAYDEEAQSLQKGNGQNTPTNIQMVTALGFEVVVIPGIEKVYLLSEEQVQQLATRLNTALEQEMRS